MSLAVKSHSIGNMYGTAFVGSAQHFGKKYGMPAANATIARLPVEWQRLLSPNHPTLGILGAKKYPYALIGELIRTMASVVHIEEDAFIREMAIAGVDATLNTVSRVIIRYMASPADVAGRSPELWHMFHDCGHLAITSLTDHDFLSEVSSWPHHDSVVCRLGVEGGRHIVERTGVKRVEARREKCQSFGHDACVTRIRWDAA